MSLSRQDRCGPETAQQSSGHDEWHHEWMQSPAEMSGLIATVLAALHEAGYGSGDIFALRLALEEALVNAVKHGHQGDLAKPVRCSYHISAERVLLEVEDQGSGFDPQQIPDPLAPENLERPSGRGLLLMRYYLTWLRYSERGNCVTLCKLRSDPLTLPESPTNGGEGRVRGPEAKESNAPAAGPQYPGTAAE